ncbi:MAG: TetR/AcrR family transcriptional regulator [Lachnospiraceae bacterium]|nr:TetR/AcrR family transcriptional regulator [Lachnospiraceae bacterium]
MDLREKKTKRSIHNAFLELRAKKPLERITIKELTELAEISKATFYLHYKDIYDLSETLQQEVISNVLTSVSNIEHIKTSPPNFTRELFYSFLTHEHLIDILFSGAQASILPTSVEKAIKETYFSLSPELKNNALANIQLTYQILGGYYAYSQNRKRFGDEFTIDMIDTITRKLT